MFNKWKIENQLNTLVLAFLLIAFSIVAAGNYYAAKKEVKQREYLSKRNNRKRPWLRINRYRE